MWYLMVVWLEGNLERVFLDWRRSLRASRTLLSNHLAARTGFTWCLQVAWLVARVAFWRVSTVTLNPLVVLIVSGISGRQDSVSVPLATLLQTVLELYRSSKCPGR